MTKDATTSDYSLKYADGSSVYLSWDSTLEVYTGSVRIDSNETSVDITVVPNDDTQIEESEEAELSIRESCVGCSADYLPYYTIGSGDSATLTIEDNDIYSVDIKDRPLANQIGFTETVPFGGCSCQETITVDQVGDIILSFRFEITSPREYISDSLTLSGTFGTDPITESANEFTDTKWFSWNSNNSDPLYVDFKFVFDRDDFSQDVDFAEYSATLTSTPVGSEPHYGMVEGIQTFTGSVTIGNNKVSVSSVERLEEGDQGMQLNRGTKGNYFANDGSGGYHSAAGSFASLSAITGGYELVDRDNNVLVFDGDGYIQTKTDPKGRVTTYTYITYGSEKLISLIEAPFYTSNFSYSDGKLTNASNTLGDWVSLAYSGNLLSSVTHNDPDGAGPLSAPVTTYSYNGYGQLTSKTGPGGLLTTYTYDSTGRLASVETPDGAETDYVSAEQEIINSGSATSTVTDNQGISTQTSYDYLGNITRKIDALGNETIYERDANGLLLTKTLPDPDGAGPLGSPVYLYTYDSRGNKLTETLPDESVRTWVYHSTWNKPVKYTDAEGRITTWTYDATYELMLTETKVIGEIDDGINLETDDLTTTYTYTSAPSVGGDPPQGLVETVTDAAGVETEYEYDEVGRRTKKTYAVGTADEAYTTSTYDSDGNVLTRTDELGNTTTYTYDDLGRQLTITSEDPDDTGPLAATVTTYTYNAMGLKATESINGRTTTYSYDSSGRLEDITEEDPDDAGPLSAPVTSYTYDSDGNVLTTTDPLGNVTTNTYTDGLLTSVTGEDPDDAGPLSAPLTSYTYDDMGRVLTVTDPLSRVTTYQYDSLGRQTSVTMPDPDGGGALTSLVSTTEYDEFGRVSSRTNFDGTTVSYTYDSEGNKLTETTDLGTTTYTYDDLGRVATVTTEDPDGVGSLVALVTTYSYTATGQLASVTTPKGTTSYTYDNRRRRLTTTLPDPDGAGGQTAPVSSTTYDDAGNVLTETDALGNVTAYEYDALNRVIEITSPDPDGAGALTSPVTEYAYDEFGQLVGMTDPNGGETTYEYDDLGRKVREIYADPDGAGSLTSPEVSYAYDAAGQMTSMTDELGNVTSYEYDNLGRRIKVTLPDPDGAGSAIAPETTYSYDAAGQLLSVTDPLNRTTTYTYDGMGRQKTVTLPDPDGAAPAGPLDAPVTTYVYNANGQLASVTDAESQTVSYTYNAAGQMATMTDPRGTTTYTYDALGRQVSVTEPDPDGAGPLSAPSTSYTYDNEGDMVSMATLDGTTSYEYDDLDRMTKVIMPDPDGAGSEVAAWTVYTYDAVGRKLTETDRLGHGTNYDYDNLGRLIKKTDAEGGETEYTYDANGNRLTLTDPEENTTTWTYDALNRMLTNTNELSDTRTYEYDAAGNVVEYTDRNGRVTVYEYDDLQRRTAEKWMDGASIVRTLSYAYDTASQLITASDPAATYTFSYDNLGRNTGVVHDLANLGFDVIVSEEYDALGRRTSLAAEIDGTDDLINTYAYDYMNRMTQVTQGSQLGGNAVAEKRVDFAYDSEDKGQFTSITRYADLAGTELVATSTYGYDKADRITSLDHEDGSSSTLAGYTWSYDEGNRLTAFTVYGYSAEDATYSYDDTDQLTGADRSGTSSDESYTYDENGNRTNTGYSTGDNNQLTSDGTYNYTYDDEGNRLTKTNISTGDYVEYTWDYRNRLTEILAKTSGGTVTHEVDYIYDIFNRRIVKTIDDDGAGSGTATEEVYIYDGLREERGAAGDHMLLRFDEADDLTDRFMYGPNVDQILASEEVSSTSAAGNVLWALTDHLGTVRDVAEYDSGTDATTIENHLAYNSFGEITSETNAAVDFLFGFTSRERDEESDLQYNRARYFGADVGRWISEDPMGFATGDENLFRYVGNQATNLTDPSGLVTLYESNFFNALQHHLYKTNDGALYEFIRAVKTGYRIHHEIQQAPAVAAWAKKYGFMANVHDARNLIMIPKAPHDVITTLQGQFWRSWGDKVGVRGKDFNIANVICAAEADGRNDELIKAYHTFNRGIEKKYGDVFIRANDSVDSIVGSLKTVSTKPYGKVYGKFFSSLISSKKKFMFIGLSLLGVTSQLITLKEIAYPSRETQLAFDRLHSFTRNALDQQVRIGYARQQTLLNVVDSADAYFRAIGAEELLRYFVLREGYLNGLNGH
ncbi:RHS repeat-associated core domain-containing protein [Bremerella sp. JC770]|uniref:RHS repeat-associated core domain-containing protein n=1 Tax=Bremerella sp. JC770 TaxID=3232137 RepID=UPI00345905B7